MLYRILILILIPAFAFGFTVVRKDGKTFSGELISQSPDGTSIRQSDGVILRFKPDQIDWSKTTLEIQKSEKQKSPVENRMGDFETREISTRKNMKWTGEKISVDFKDVDLRDFFRFIADFSNMNLILDPAVQGTLTIKMVDVPWDQVLDLVCRNYSLGYEITGNVVNVNK